MCKLNGWTAEPMNNNRYPAVTATVRRLCEMRACKRRIPRKRAIPKHRPKIYFILVFFFFSFACLFHVMPCNAVSSMAWLSAGVFVFSFLFFILYATGYGQHTHTHTTFPFQFHRHSSFRHCVLFLWVFRFSIARIARNRDCASLVRGIFSWTAFCRKRSTHLVYGQMHKANEFHSLYFSVKMAYCESWEIIASNQKFTKRNVWRKKKIRREENVEKNVNK